MYFLGDDSMRCIGLNATGQFSPLLVITQTQPARARIYIW